MIRRPAKPRRTGAPSEASNTAPRKSNQVDGCTPLDVLVGINLLREGLDLPEVSLVAILDADKEGYLRSTTSLIQTAGRAARHLHGEVILYADVKTQSIQRFLTVSSYRRERQLAYNQEHGITPCSVIRALEESLVARKGQGETAAHTLKDAVADFDVVETVRELEAEMLEAANNLEFEKAARLRDRIEELKRQFGQTSGPAKALATSAASALSYRKGKKRQEDHRPERSDQALWLAYQHRAAAVGFAATLCCYIGVNLFLSGLHSYGKL